MTTWREQALAQARQPGLLPGERRALDDLLNQYVGLPETWTRCPDWPPCGGCDACVVGQATYGFEERARERYRRAQLGLLVAPVLISIPPGILPWPASCSTYERMLKG
jgi:hypothetical protein